MQSIYIAPQQYDLRVYAKSNDGFTFYMRTESLSQSMNILVSLKSYHSVLQISNYINFGFCGGVEEYIDCEWAEWKRNDGSDIWRLMDECFAVVKGE